MSRSSRSLFQTVRSEGGLLPADLLQRVAEGDRDLGGMRAEDYHLTDLPLNEAIVRSWNRLAGAWVQFRDARRDLPEDDPGTTLTRERWLLVLFEELRFGRLQTARAVEIEGKSYPVSHGWDHVPIHLVGCNVPLDRRSAGVAGAATYSPHGLLQELLNRSEERLWGFLSNGLLLRLLRDNSSFTRQAYLEFDLEQMMESEAYADFVLLWLTCHQSRVEGERPHECWLERWSQEAVKQGTRALDSLRAGVEAAIRELGAGFLTPGQNAELRDALRSGVLSRHDYYRQLLRLVYRLLFLFVAEDRGLLHDPQASDVAKERFARWYSTRRLRNLAERRRGTKHGDLWEGLKEVMSALGSSDGLPSLGLPALGSFLWSHRALPDLDHAQLPNRALLEAVRALATVRDGKVLRGVDYKNLGAEELGSVYESLLELHPELDADAGAFALRVAAGSERKTTGSYYTPSSLIGELLDSALDPVLEEAAGLGEEAILDLKVVDPACGSGHFLVAAAHRIAKRLARHRTGDEEPSPEAIRHALRDVVSRCIYGVDVNPMAVELCQVSLWMEALDPGRPLSFLDAHIKCGNSLLGATPLLLAAGLPDDAFKLLEGDEKAVASDLRKRNRLEHGGQLTLEDEVTRVEAELRERAVSVDREADGSPKELRAKEEHYRDLVESPLFEQARLLADAWCAAFVQRKTAGAPQITEATLRRIAQATSRLPTEERAAIEALRQEYAFFHWHVEFPQVFRVAEEEEEEPQNEQTGWSGGFDCVFGNPPWERLKLQEKEFFAERSPEIAAAPNKAARERLIKRLKEADPALDEAFRDARRRSDGESHLVRTTGRYPLAGRGDVNTYSVFAELMRSAISPTGRVGCILPLGIATDDTTKHFFGDLVQTGSLVSLFGFENEEFIFPAVHHATRFCLLTLTGHSQPAAAAEFTFFLRQVEALREPGRKFTLVPEDFALLNPNTRTCPIFRSRRDADLTKAIYRRVPVLVDERGGADGDPWGVTFMAMFHMANDSGLFRTRDQLEGDGWRLDGNVFRDGANAYLPLYEAKMLHHFDHRFGTYDGQTEAQANQGKLPELSDDEHAQSDLYSLPRYWVPTTEVDTVLGGKWSAQWLLGWRRISGTEKARTIIASVVPRVAVGDSWFVLLATKPGQGQLVANLSAFVFDYAARQKMGGTNASYFIMQQLPVLEPNHSANAVSQDWIRDCVLELTYTAWDLEPFARELGYRGPPFRWDAERRFLLRCELDASFFHLYGLEREDVDYVMDTFPIIRDRDVKAHGEYRTKCVILEIYDELAAAIESGVPYETRLDPPPADPRVAHPPRAAAVEAPA